MRHLSSHAHDKAFRILDLSLSPFQIAYCSIVVLICYALRGSAGFGAAAAMPLLALVIPTKTLIPAWTLIGLVAGITLFGRGRAHIAWRDIARMALPTLVGVAIGTYIFIWLDQDNLRRGFGVLVVLYGSYALWKSFRPPESAITPPKYLAPLVGFLGGVVGATFGTMASVFYAIYFDTRQLSKTVFRATMTALLVALSIARALGYWTVDEYGREALELFVISLPVMFAGIFIGDRLHMGLSETTFRRLIAGTLVVSGLALLAK